MRRIFTSLEQFQENNVTHAYTTRNFFSCLLYYVPYKFDKILLSKIVITENS